MSQTIRTFLAAPLPKEIQADLGQEVEKIKNALPDWQVNWVKPENLHVTLIFFGRVPEEKIGTLKKDVGTALEDFSTFEISTGELSAPGRPFWLEIEKGKQELAKLHQQLKKNLSVKSQNENRSFHAHLTIGRIKKKGKSKLPKIEKSFSWKVDQVVLYESKLRREGSVYKVLKTTNLSQS